MTSELASELAFGSQAVTAQERQLLMWQYEVR
jgi:hypothetical protein